MTCGIYLIKNKKTGQKYIGQSTNIEKRWSQHKNGRRDEKQSYIHSAIKKYGVKNFEFIIINICENDKELLNELEKYYIWKYNTFEDKNHYNLTPGGDFNPMDILEFRQKLSTTKQGVPLWQDKKHPMQGKILSQETRQLISKSTNTTGIYRVCKLKDDRCKQGYTWVYQYENKALKNVDLQKLKEKVISKKLPWIEFKEVTE